MRLRVTGTKQRFGFSVLGMSLYTGKDKTTFKLLNKAGTSRDNVKRFSRLKFLQHIFLMYM